MDMDVDVELDVEVDVDGSCLPFTDSEQRKQRRSVRHDRVQKRHKLRQM